MAPPVELPPTIPFLGGPISGHGIFWSVQFRHPSFLERRRWLAQEKQARAGQA